MLNGIKTQNRLEIKMLELKKEEFFVMDSEEFDNLVNDFYDSECSDFVLDQEADNDSCYKFHVDKTDMDFFLKYSKEELDSAISDIKKGKHTYIDISDFLYDMVNENHIPEGNYLIRVCW